MACIGIVRPLVRNAMMQKLNTLYEALREAVGNP